MISVWMVILISHCRATHIPRSQRSVGANIPLRFAEGMQLRPLQKAIETIANRALVKLGDMPL